MRAMKWEQRWNALTLAYIVESCYSRRSLKGYAAKMGNTFVLPRLPPLPPILKTDLYTSTHPSAQKFRKVSRACNCRSNFASMNVEDGELKRMFGDHLLSVQGRTRRGTRNFSPLWVLLTPNPTFLRRSDLTI
ncbi:unnamed protein product [Ectocarpus sp. 12 AP-2014]